MARSGVLWLFAFAGILSAQVPAKVDFSKEILPLFRQNCWGCHGPAVQQAGMRLDRKSSAMKPLTRRIVAGSSPNSFVYLRIAGTDFGRQMPPTGALRPEQIAVVKAWIDQGADWPDSLANEKSLPPLNQKAVAMVEWLHSADLASFMRTATADPSLLNARGPEGSTPFMYAVLYCDAATLAKLLKLGADPNKQNDAQATALMWAARDLAKTRVLVEHGAAVNAKSADSRTPLMIAARRFGAAPVVKLLLDHQADPNPNANPIAESSPLLEALTAGDATIVDMLLENGADAKATAEMGLTMAVNSDCPKCLNLIAPHISDKDAYTGALENTAHLGDVPAIRLMLDHGADVNAFDPLGRTSLMYAAVSDLLPLEAVKLLIEHGADVNARDRHKNSGDAGLTVLDIARRHGDTPIVQLLLKSGAKATPEASPALQPRRDNSIRSAVQDSLPLLQRADVSFASKAGCISCHNNSMTAMTVALARTRGFRIDEQTASAQQREAVQFLAKIRENLHQGFATPVGDFFNDFALGYVLLGLHAENYPPDINTDALALYTLSHQKPNGEWPYPRADGRPPICMNYVTQTAIAMRVLQLYAPATSKAAAGNAIGLAASWLAKVESYSNEDRSWRLTGLAWAGTDKASTQAARKDLLAAQKADGGWSDLPSMASSAFATGESLVALHNAGLPVSDPAYQRGIKFLLDTQQQDGSWYVQTRALGLQPGFDAGFPHGYNQFISSAGTGWAAMALTLALPEAGPVTASRLP